MSTKISFEFDTLFHTLDVLGSSFPSKSGASSEDNRRLILRITRDSVYLSTSLSFITSSFTLEPQEIDLDENDVDEDTKSVWFSVSFDSFFKIISSFHNLTSTVVKSVTLDGDSSGVVLRVFEDLESSDSLGNWWFLSEEPEYNTGRDYIVSEYNLVSYPVSPHQQHQVLKLYSFFPLDTFKRVVAGDVVKELNVLLQFLNTSAINSQGSFIRFDKKNAFVITDSLGVFTSNSLGLDGVILNHQSSKYLQKLCSFFKEDLEIVISPNEVHLRAFGVFFCTFVCQPNIISSRSYLDNKGGSVSFNVSVSYLLILIKRIPGDNLTFRTSDTSMLEVSSTTEYGGVSFSTELPVSLSDSINFDVPVTFLNQILKLPSKDSQIKFLLNIKGANYFATIEDDSANWCILSRFTSQGY